VTQLHPEHNPYEPPQAQVADSNRAQMIKPQAVRWAVTALWASYGLSFVHAAISIGDRWTVWPPEHVVLSQLGSELFYAVLLAFVSRGEYAARLIYAVLLGVRTVNVIRYIPDDWQSYHGLVLVTAISFSCQYMAMYWLFTEPGRRWFARSLA
jgi:hypothetical protein